MSSQGLVSTAGKIDELESIRGLAALLVVFYHIPKWHPMMDIGVINNGYLMVELFFVLSGFVIFSAYGGRINSRADLFRFQFLRFGRLYPVHLLFLLVFVLIELAKYLAATKLGIVSTNTEPFRENNLLAFAQQLLLVQAIGPTGNELTFNGPAWSISVEFYTYLIFGLVILSFNSTRIYLFSAIAVVSVVLLATKFTFGFTDLLRCLAGFFVGCLTAVATRHASRTWPSYASLLVAAAILVFLHVKTTRDFDSVIFLLTAALIASLVLSPNSLLNRLLNLRALGWLGAVSYSVYMCHAAVIWTVNQTFRVFLGRPEAIDRHGNSVPQLSVADTLLGSVVIIAAVLVVSGLVFNFVEKPLRERSRRFAASHLR